MNAPLPIANTGIFKLNFVIIEKVLKKESKNKKDFLQTNDSSKKCSKRGDNNCILMRVMKVEESNFVLN